MSTGGSGCAWLVGNLCQDLLFNAFTLSPSKRQRGASTSLS